MEIRLERQGKGPDYAAAGMGQQSRSDRRSYYVCSEFLRDVFDASAKLLALRLYPNPGKGRKGFDVLFSVSDPYRVLLVAPAGSEEGCSTLFPEMASVLLLMGDTGLLRRGRTPEKFRVWATVVEKRGAAAPGWAGEGPVIVGLKRREPLLLPAPKQPF